MRDRHTLRSAGGPGSEDYPGIIGRCCLPRSRERPDPLGGGDDLTCTQDPGDPCLFEHQACPLVRVISVDRNIGGTDMQDGQDREVQLVGPGRNPHADLVSGADPGLVEAPSVGLHITDQLRITERAPPVVQSRGVREPLGGFPEDLNQGARRGSVGSAGQLRAVGCHHPSLSEIRPERVAAPIGASQSAGCYGRRACRPGPFPVAPVGPGVMWSAA